MRAGGGAEDKILPAEEEQVAAVEAAEALGEEATKVCTSVFMTSMHGGSSA